MVTRNPYAPPQAEVADATMAVRIKPRQVAWGMTALWVSYGLAFLHAVIAIAWDGRLWPPQAIVFKQAGSEVFYAALLCFVASGRYWARLIYAVLLGVRTVAVIRDLPINWQTSKLLLGITIVSFLCQYIAMYWLFTEPGRRWFVTRPAPEL